MGALSFITESTLFRSYTLAKTQIVIVAFIAFCCPGIFNALNGLGGAGSSNPTVSNNANTALYATFAVFGYFGGLFFNLFGNRMLMGFGGATYCFYAICQYVAGVDPKLDWLAILSGAVLGFGAGLFWTAQGAMMMAYATSEKKGTYISIFWVIFNLGGVFGGILSFGLNFNTQQGQASPASYFTFAGIMACGSISAFFLLCSPTLVVREDGEHVTFGKETGPIDEFKNVAMMFLNRNMQLLTPIFVASNWFRTYQFDAINGGLFTVRSRGMNSALFWMAQMLGAFLFGQLFLDCTRISKRNRGIYGFGIIVVNYMLNFGLGLYLEVGYMGGFAKNFETTPECEGKIWSPYTQTCRDRLDIAQSRIYFFPIFIFTYYGFNEAMMQTYAYWIMGAITDDCSESARFAGYYKGIQSAGAAVAWSIDNSLSKNPKSWIIQFAICWGLFGLYIIPTWAIAYFNISNSTNPVGEMVEVPPAADTESKKIEFMA